VNFLLLSTERSWHGGEEQLLQLAKGIRQQGHPLWVAARRGGEVAGRFEQLGFDVIPLRGNVRGLQAVWQVRTALRNRSLDLLFANDPHALSLMHIATWGLRRRPIKVATRRVLYPIRSCRKYTKGVDAVVCVSNAIAGICREAGIPDDLLHVVHDGVDANRVAAGDPIAGRRALGLGSDVPLVLCVAALVPCKGHRHLIEAWPAVLRELPLARLVFAGDGPLRQELEGLATTHGVGGSVDWLGYRRDVPDLIQACDLMVLPSPEEGLGSSLLDGLFARKPVVAADAGGLPEIVETSSGDLAGWLVPPADPAALANALAEALSDREEAACRAARGEAWARQEFTAERMVERTLALFEALAHE
jgi:glycosyltransferase involved in cell wall biosynthesis